MNNKKNDNHYFLFINNNSEIFFNMETLEATTYKPKNNNLSLIVDNRISKAYIYKLLKELHIVNLYFLQNILLLMNFEYNLINFKNLYITSKKNFNGSIFINIFEEKCDKNLIRNNSIENYISLKDFLFLIESIDYLSYLDTYEKTYIILNKYFYKAFFLNLLLLIINIYIKFTANK
jgi:hypothetical protein